MRRIPLLFLLVPLACERTHAPPVDRSDGTLPALHAPHIASPHGSASIHVDGRLNEREWQRAGTTGAFVSPGDGRPAPDSQVQATARVTWDDDNLYVGVVVDDRDPTTPFHHDDIDPHLWERASAIEVMIQPGDLDDNRDYYELQVDTVGAVWDTHFDDYNQPVVRDESGATRFGHQEWSAGLLRAATVERGHYTIEMALPWTSIVGARVPVPPHAGDTWRVNFYSFRDGQRDALAWSPILGRGNFHRSNRWGRVTFDR